jgi:hypothetical protein
MRDAGMLIGAHTVTHPILARLNADAVLSEARESKQFLESLIQERVGLFAYPNGKPDVDYRAADAEIIRGLDFDAAVTTAWGVADVQCDRMQLPRFTPGIEPACALVQDSSRTCGKARAGERNRGRIDPMTDSISVIIPCFNAEPYLAAAIRSVQAQDWRDLEIVVVDDGSSDRSAELVRDTFPEVTLIRQANQGVAAARNTGIRSSRGDWIAFLDADDIWLPGKLQAQMDLLNGMPGCRMSYTAWQVWNSTAPSPPAEVLTALQGSGGRTCPLVRRQRLDLPAIAPRLRGMDVDRAGAPLASFRGGRLRSDAPHR